MTVREFRTLLEAHPGLTMHFMLPDKAFVPSHYHITEIGRVHKDFIDCGGTVRSTTACLLQIWVANDVDPSLPPGAHRPTGARSCRSMTIAASFKPRLDELPAIDIHSL